MQTDTTFIIRTPSDIPALIGRYARVRGCLEVRFDSAKHIPAKDGFPAFIAASVREAAGRTALAVNYGDRIVLHSGPSF